MTGETELRRASDSFLKQVERLHELEEEKRLATPGTPEMLRLSRHIERLAGEMLGAAGRQSDAAELAAGRQPPGLRPIVDIPPRPIPQIIAEWRNAERTFEAAEPDSPEQEVARTDIELLREEYRRAYELRRD